MSKAVTLTVQEASYKERAEYYLAETQKILRRLAADRQREERRRQDRPREKSSNILSEIKAILYGN
jgi:hypothetical protein